MAIAKVLLNDLIKCRDETECFIKVLQQMQSQMETLEKADRDIQKEAREYEEALQKCEQIISALEEKIRRLEAKQQHLENRIQILKAEIQAVNLQIPPIEAEIAALYTELAAAAATASPAVGAIHIRIHQAKANLGALKSQKANLEEELDQAQEELEETIDHIQTAQDLLSQTREKQSEICEGIQQLNSASGQLQQTMHALSDWLQQMIDDSRRATDGLQQAEGYIGRYMEIHASGMTYKPTRVTFAKCLNLEYAGKTFDYASERQAAESARMDKTSGKYDALVAKYNVRAAADGKVTADVEKNALTRPIVFAPRTKENMANGTCLTGTNYKGSSEDADRIMQELIRQGYTEKQIMELAQKGRPLYSEDGQSVRIVPDDLGYILTKNKFSNENKYKVSDYLDGGQARMQHYEQLQQQYPDIIFSELNAYGMTYPNLRKYELLSFRFPPVSKETYNANNPAASQCLIGDSETGSPDFAKFKQKMRETGYTDSQIKELLNTYTIHHDEDGVTLRLVPRELHEAVRHNGGAEVIRRQIAEL